MMVSMSEVDGIKTLKVSLLDVTIYLMFSKINGIKKAKYYIELFVHGFSGVIRLTKLLSN